VTDPSDLKVLRLLEASPNRTQREMAHELGMSLGKANYVLKALLAKGLVKAQNFKNSNNKRGYSYMLTPAGISTRAEMTKQFLARKLEEYDALRREIEELKGEQEQTDEKP
jgi:EPS-associated MarR family transcriptional regulator